MSDSNANPAHSQFLQAQAEALLDANNTDEAQVRALLAVASAVRELTDVVRLMAPAGEPDPEAGKGYMEFELEASAAASEIELDPSVDVADIDVDVDV